MKIDSNISRIRAHGIMVNSVAPQPIAFVSTVDSDGGFNLAPCGVVMPICMSPIIIGMSIDRRERKKKDIASMYIGNAMLLILNLPLIPLWVKVLKIPYRILFPLIILFTIIGSYSVNNSMFDVGLTIFFGVAGYFLRKFNFEMTPLIMAFILGPLLEEAVRQSLIISRGNFAIFIQRPISLTFLLIGAAFLLFPLGYHVYRRRDDGKGLPQKTDEK
jgi:hypothetical protein